MIRIAITEDAKRKEQIRNSVDKKKLCQVLVIYLLVKNQSRKIDCNINSRSYTYLIRIPIYI